MKPATVGEIIEALEKLPVDAPCYFRPKYHGDVKYYEEVPVNKHGIVMLENNQVTFLC